MEEGAAEPSAATQERNGNEGSALHITVFGATGATGQLLVREARDPPSEETSRIWHGTTRKR